MTDLPNRAHLASSYPVPTWSQHMAALGGLYDVVGQLCGTQQSEALTITAGRVSPARGSITVDSEGGTAADDLTHIGPAAFPLGRWLYIRCASAAHVITVKHQAGGEGQITLVAGREMILNALDKWLLLERSGSGWSEIARGYGSDAPAARSALGLATVAVSGSYADLSNKPDLTALSGYAKTTTGAKVEAFDMYSADLNAIENTPGIVVTECSDTVTNRPSQITSNSLLLQIADGGGNDIRAQWLLSPSGSSVYQRIKWGGGLPGNWSAWCTIWSSANDGAGSGLDADQLDGLHASQITGAVKKYLVLDQYNGNIIQNSLGISSITDHAVGQYTVSFTAPWPSTYYVPATCNVGDDGYPDCVVIEDVTSRFNWTTSQIRMAHKPSGTSSYVDGRPDTLIFAGM